MGSKNQKPDRSCEKQPDAFLNKLNSHLETFIADVIEADSALGPFPALAKLRTLAGPNDCWTVNDCTKTDCLSYANPHERCWLTAGTLCDGLSDGDFAQKLGSCLKCEVYQHAHTSRETALVENINVLLFHLNTKAQKLREMAIHDGLTGLYNRQFFDEVIDREIANAKRRHELLGLMMIDVDNFKTINDDFGHMVGDDALQTVANILTNSVRKSDLVFRFGGDEFVVLLTNMQDGRLDRTRARIQNAIEELNTLTPDTHWELGLSIGDVVFDAHKQSITNALLEADRNMYRQKAKAS
ncbi:GGDEF domain-containing protein [Magnetovibrio sp. PR-2]|uniref:GGDEF domain-containing protein n=1 Tax=Magnetovibrio sp. PR-2 TaxID=3120356 RepID=UPI002FCE1597